MAFEKLNYTKSWENREDFPTYEPDEEAVRKDLQLLHDEAKDAINKLVDALNASSAAKNLPFEPQWPMTAKTIQAAIEEVYSAITDKEQASILNGSVSKEKLTEELMRRIYGGSVTVSMEEPKAETDLPVGQIWLRPAVQVQNLISDTWSVIDGTAEQVRDGWCFTADQEELYVEQTICREELAGQTVLLNLRMGDCSGLQTLSLYLMGEEVPLEQEEQYFLQTEFDQSGELAVQMRATFADGGDKTVTVELLTAAAVPGTAAGWEWKLKDLGWFEQADIPADLWVQTAPGVWDEVLSYPVRASKGGTGLGRVEKGALLLGTGEETLRQLMPVKEGVLQCVDGSPQWVQPGSGGYPYVVSGSYTGDGAEKTRTLDLGVEPLFLLIHPADNSAATAVLTNGGTAVGKYGVDNSGHLYYDAVVRLSGQTLQFSSRFQGNGSAPARHLNEAGVTYHWLAVLGVAA